MLWPGGNHLQFNARIDLKLYIFVIYKIYLLVILNKITEQK